MRRLAILLAALAAAFALVACGGKSGGRIWLTHNPMRFGGISGCTASCFEATIQWSLTYPGATGYYVYENGTEVADVNTPGWSFTGLACGQSYTLAVKAHNGSGGTGPLVSTSYSSPACLATFPLQVSANGRYLETASGSPWLLVGDSPQSIIGNLTQTDANNYLDDRKAEGFSAVWDNLLCDDYTACAASGVAQGDGSGTIAPFTVGTAPSSYAVGGESSAPYCGDCNTAYFSRAHAIIAHAETDGIEVFLDPAETGGWLPFTEGNGDGTLSTTNGDYRYGEYLGYTFKDLPNIIWLMGNDFQNMSVNPDMDNLKTLEAGIQATDPTALFTVETDYTSTFSTSTSVTDANGFATTWSSYINLDSVYTYSPAFDGISEANTEAPTDPSILIESNYEGQKNGTYDGCQTVRNCRLQEWWTMTSGAAGQFYGGNYQSSYGTADDGSYGLQHGFTNANIDTIGATQLGYETSFLKSIAWQTLKPDTSHVVVTAGVGTCDASPHSIVAETCVTTASDYTGTAGSATLAVSYLPDPSALSTITVNMADFANGTVSAQWYDPTDGHYFTVSGSPFTSGSGAGTQTFTPTGNNSAGDKDWVLLLQANPNSGFAVSCPLTYAAGAGSNSTSPTAEDGSGGTCWGQQTGVYAGTGDTVAQIEANPTGLGFTHHTGDLTVSTPGTTINKYWVDGGCINVTSGANNVTIENTLITDANPDCSQANTGASALNAGDQLPVTSTGVLVKDVTIDGAPSGDSLSKTNAITIQDGTVEQTNVFGFAQGFTSNQSDESHPAYWQDNYAHDFQSCAHDDGTWVDSGAYVSYVHNWIETNDPANAGCATGACVGGSDSLGAPEHDVTYANNFCDGVDGEDGQTGCGGYDITLKNNVLDNTAAKFDAYGGYTSSGFQDSWTGNQQIDHSGTLSSAADPSSACAGLVNTSPPTVGGTATHGDVLTVTSNGTWTGESGTTFYFQWFRCDTSGASCVVINGATNSTYTLTTGDEGYTMRALVDAANSTGVVGNQTAVSAQTATVN